MKGCHNSISNSCRGFIIFISALYLAPYFRVQHGMGEYLIIREALGAGLVAAIWPRLLEIAPRIPVWFYLMLAANLFGLLLSDDYGTAFLTLRSLMQFSCVYVFTAAVVQRQAEFMAVCRLHIALGIVTVGCVLVQALLGPIDFLNIYPAYDEASQRFGLNRYGSFFGNSITTAMFIVIIYWQFAFFRLRRFARVGIAVIALGSVALTLSKAPAALMSLSVAVVLFAPQYIIRPYLSIKDALRPILVLVLASIGIAMLPGYDQIIMDEKTVKEHIAEDIRYRTVDKYALTEEALKRKGGLAILFGCGFDSAGQAAAEHTIDGFRPHNVILEVFVTMGVLGVAAYVLAIIEVIGNLLRVDGRSSIGIWVKGLALGTMCAFASAAFVDPHVTNVIMVPFFVVAAVLRFRINPSAPAEISPRLALSSMPKLRRGILA